MKKVIGIDIGGTKILGGVIDNSGRLLNEKSFPTEAWLGRETILKNLFQLLDVLITPDIKGIGVGTAGRINYNSGIVDYATNNLPGWIGTNLRDEIQKKYDLPVVIDNDVNAAAVGECWLGAGKNYRDILMFTLGTGVGGAIVNQGELIRGAHWSAGEIGHMILYPNGIECNCGQNGCLEQYVSGSAIYKRYNQITGYKKVENAKQVFELLEQGDGVSRKVIREFVAHLSLALVSLRNIIDPDIVIIGGGLIGAKQFWWNDLNQSVSSDIQLYAAELGAKATIFGASKLIFDMGI